MAKVRRISGDLRLELSFNDRSNQYQVKICPVRGQHDRCERIKVGAPRSMRIAVDSPKAYNEAAHAAISFASDRIQERAETDKHGRGWLIRTPRRPRR